ncbi:DUF4344 domain-containing metallopeptidase [Porticoccus sp.]
MKWLLVAVTTTIAILPPSLMASVNYQPVQSVLQTSWRIAAGACQFQQIGLEQGSVLYGAYSIRGAVDSRLDVQLLDEWNFGLWRIGQPYQHYTAMSGTVNGAARLQFTAPKAGRYVATFCNNKAVILERFVDVNLYKTTSVILGADKAMVKAFEQMFISLREGLQLPDFDVSIAPCGTANAFSDPNITICTEMFDDLPSDESGGSILAFIFLHELGHSALKLWSMPGWDNEDTADEFASAFLLMANQGSVVERAAQWWLAKASNVRDEALRKIVVDDRHSLSIQRARNLHRWAQDDGDLIQRWMTVFAPHLTDSGLRDTANDDRFREHPAIIKEVARRGGKAIAAEAQSTAANPATGLTQRLTELKQAHEAGLITDEEYTSERKKAIGR